MVKKIITGLAISLGAGLALTVTNLGNRKKNECCPPTGDNDESAAAVRIHSAVPLSEQNRMQEGWTSQNPPAAGHPATAAELDDAMAMTMSSQQSAELAEIKVMIEALDQRSNEMINAINQRIDDLQNHLPRFIDVKVTSRIREVEDRLRIEFQDEQSRTLDAFLSTLDLKVLPRISMIEEAVGAQGAEIGEMRQRIEKTDLTLDLILNRMEKVVDSTSSPYPEHANSHIMEIHQKAVA